MSETPILNEPVPTNMPAGRNSMPGDSGFQMDGTLRRMVAGQATVEVVESKVEATLPVVALAKRGLIDPKELTEQQRREAELFLPGGPLTRQNHGIIIPGEEPEQAEIRRLQAQLEERRAAKARAAELEPLPSGQGTSRAFTFATIAKLATEIIIETATADPDKVRDVCRDLATTILTHCR